MAKNAWASRMFAVFFNWRFVHRNKLYLGIVEFSRKSGVAFLAEWFVQLGSSPLGYQILLPRGRPAAKKAFTVAP